MKYIKGINRHGSETFLLLLKNSQSLEIENIIKSSTTERGKIQLFLKVKGLNGIMKEIKIKLYLSWRKKQILTIKLK